MKTSIQKITLILILNSLFAGLVLAQVNPPETPVPQAVPTPVQQSREDTLAYAQDLLRDAERQGAITDSRRSFEQSLRMQIDRLAQNQRTTSGDEVSVLVIPTGPIDTEELSTINEDISIMSSIIRNNLEQSGSNTLARTIYGSFWGQRQNELEATYLQGYGVLFSMIVGFPLSAPPDLQENQQEPEDENVDTVWEQTRQQIYEPQTSLADYYRRYDEIPVIKYDAQRVENLKTNLIQSLKHASNIRALQPEESVILSVRGDSNASGLGLTQEEGNNTSIITYSTSEGRSVVQRIEGEISNDDYIKLFSPTVLVIRAKKSDIYAFAEGELDFDKFREKVQILGYPLLGGTANATPVPRAASTINYPPAWTAPAQ